MLSDDNRNIVYQDYTAEMAGMLVRAVAGFGGNKIELPSFYEMVYPEKKDNRTGQQIKDHILKLLD